MEQKISKEAINLIKEHEGLRLTVYRDAAGLETIGYGHLLKGEEVGNLREITMEQADDFLKADIVEAEEGIARYVKVPLNENQRGALVSWVFNLGVGAFRSSTLIERINAREFHRAPGEMMRWIIAGGRPLKGLIRRRAAEAELFIT